MADAQTAAGVTRKTVVPRRADRLSARYVPFETVKPMERCRNQATALVNNAVLEKA